MEGIVLPEQGTWVEGVGDEVVVVLGGCFSLLFGLVVYLSGERRRTIHPENAARVHEARQRLRAGQPADGETDQQRPARRENGEPCPVCLIPVEFGVETNCGHLFCATCIITYWQYGNWLGCIKCPVCRQQVTILLPSFTAEEEASPDRHEFEQRIHEYNRRYSGEPRPYMDYIRDAPTLLRQMIREFFSPGGVLWIFHLRFLCIFVFLIFYILSPLDIIPEGVVGVFGVIDDILVLVTILLYFTLVFREVMVERAMRAGVPQ